MVAILDEPEDFNDWTALCQKVDNRRRSLQQESGSRTSPATSSRYAPNSPSVHKPPAASQTPLTFVGTYLGPMDLSASSRKLSLEERACRMAERRCLYCGGLSHMTMGCSNTPDRRSPPSLRAAEAAVVPSVSVPAFTKSSKKV